MELTAENYYGTVKLIKAWLNYQRAKIRRRHDEKVSKRSSKKSEL